MNKGGMSEASQSGADGSTERRPMADENGTSHHGAKKAKGILKRPKSGDSESFLADTEGEASASTHSSHQYTSSKLLSYFSSD